MVSRKHRHIVQRNKMSGDRKLLTVIKNSSRFQYQITARMRLPIDDQW